LTPVVKQTREVQITGQQVLVAELGGDAQVENV
jgi:hypothetical protein